MKKFPSNFINWLYDEIHLLCICLLFNDQWTYTYDSLAAIFAACLVYHNATFIAMWAASNTVSHCSLKKNK